MGLRIVSAAEDPQRPVLVPGRGRRPPAYRPLEDFWFHPLPEHSLELTLEYVRGGGGTMAPPNSPQFIEIGIVLNVLYDHVRVDYGDGGVYQTPRTFARPILDCLDRTSAPWVHPPLATTITIPIVNPDLGEQPQVIESVVEINPHYARIYGSEGLGELLDPFSGTGYATSPLQRLTLRFTDRPRLAVRRVRYGSRLQRMEQVLWFQFWAVVMPGRRILATSPPYTLGGWFETHPTSYRTFEPAPTHFSYGLPGRHRRLFRSDGEVERAKRGQRGDVRQGRVGRLPVVDGETANERITAWVEREDLAPRLPTARSPASAVSGVHR